MIIPPKYNLTVLISHCLQRIASVRSVIDSIKIVPEVETTIRRQATLKSSLYSARIEGNPLTLDELPGLASSDLKKREVFNILRSLEFVHKQNKGKVTRSDLLHIHEIIMNGLVVQEVVGNFRKEASAIFNVAGVAVYLPPLHSEVDGLIDRLIEFVNSSDESFVPVRAVLSHYVFEKIHPFLDGNGRVGRLFLQLVLEKGGYGMKGLLSVEEYLDAHRSDYYDALNLPETDVTGYVEFMLEAIASAADGVKSVILEKRDVRVEDFLLPRRAEILRIIREQKLINFNSIHRRFLKVNERTLRYDLKKLVDAEFIRKRGTTRGVYYEAVV